MLFKKKLPSEDAIQKFWSFVDYMFNDINDMVRDEVKTKEKVTKILNPIYAALEDTLKCKNCPDLLFGIKDNIIDMKIVHFNDKQAMRCLKRLEELLPDSLKVKLTLTIVSDRDLDIKWL